MSEAYTAGEGQPAGRRRRRIASRRPRALLPTLVVVVLLVVAFSIFVELYTNHLWYASIGYGSVWSKILVTRIVLFLVFGAVFAGVVVGNIVLAYRMRPILLADGYRNPTVERYQDAVDPYRRWIVVGFALMLFLFAGASGAGRWKTYMLWRNAVPFHQEDVYFHKDIGFYVFGYPWYRYLLSFGFTALIIALVAAAATHYLYGAIRIPSKRERVTTSAQMHLSILMGLFVSLKAVAYWLDKYGLVMHDGSLITGITYTDKYAVLPSKTVLMLISIICALLFFGNVVRPGWLLPVLGFGLLVLSAILIGGIWPMIVQRFQVRPSEPDKEAPFIAKNITATRSAYDLTGNISRVSYPGSTTLDATQLRQAADELPGVRIIDPRLVSQAFVQLQQMRGFYTMPNVLDVDRYAIGSNPLPQDVIVSSRELNLNGLRGDQRNWNNDHTVYTHGYGMIAAYADQRGPQGVPDWAEKNLPTVGQLGHYRQQIYFGEHEPDYSIVGAPPSTPPVELNIPSLGGSGQDQTSTYHGDGGVGIGSTFRQLIYAAKFWDSSILLSQRVNADSRIIYDRDPLTMVKKVAPWLSLDGDPYPAIVDGKLEWILDGYTTSDDYPMSQLVNFAQATSDSLTPENAVAGQSTDKINYIRNSVKVTVDAFSGQVKLYQWDVSDPILRTWMNAFPGVVLPKKDISPDLLAHLRYPEDLFKVQRQILSTYHVTSGPLTFYNGSENWKVPEDPTDATTNESQPPFYMSLQLPVKGATPQFALSSVYVPQSRQNMASFMSVDSNPASAGYGRITLLQLPSDTTIDGPGQVSNEIANDPKVTNLLLRYSRSGTQVRRGNLLTVPLAGEMLYAQPVYTLRQGSASYPILQYVTVALGDRVGIGRTFDAAVASALNLSNTAPGGGQGGTGGGGGGHGGGHQGGHQTLDQRVSELLAESQQAFEDAQHALSQGDLAQYQSANTQGLDLLNRAITLRGKEQAGQDPGSGPTKPASTANTPTGGSASR